MANCPDDGTKLIGGKDGSVQGVYSCSFCGRNYRYNGNVVVLASDTIEPSLVVKQYLSRTSIGTVEATNITKCVFRTSLGLYYRAKYAKVAAP